ncbi:hypothetical protein ERO13_D08G221350v2 [Gossypium hirsutum]|uniref:Uncharacterized protein n=1 Tax=Gossypium hirsutum TaxID=3635 RepID=A0A1U8M7B9_GOSHI|nr:uncharacterized protein LOC107933794 [Gossypium hirsutum]KAG4135533.1 hypothetical protein ERO13_D08G221350v2 [Gossypium hirsutum]
MANGRQRKKWALRPLFRSAPKLGLQPKGPRALDLYQSPLRTALKGPPPTEPRAIQVSFFCRRWRSTEARIFRFGASRGCLGQRVRWRHMSSGVRGIRVLILLKMFKCWARVILVLGQGILGSLL